MFKEENDKNELILSGKIVNIFPAKNCVIVTLRIGNQTFPKVVCWQNNAELILEKYKVNSDICLLCNIQSSCFQGKITTSIFCTEILNEPITESDTCNDFIVKGRIHSVYESKHLIKVIVETTTNGRYSTIPICIYNNMPRWHYEKHQPFCARGNVETRRKSSNGRTNYFTNFVASYISDY